MFVEESLHRISCFASNTQLNCYDRSVTQHLEIVKLCFNRWRDSGGRGEGAMSRRGTRCPYYLTSYVPIEFECPTLKIFSSRDETLYVAPGFAFSSVDTLVHASLLVNAQTKCVRALRSY